MEPSEEQWTIDRLDSRVKRLEGETAQLRESHNRLQQTLYWAAVLILAALIFRMGVAKHQAEERAREPTTTLQAGVAVPALDVC